MDMRIGLRLVLVLSAALGLLLAGSVQAKDKYQSSMVAYTPPLPDASSDYTLTKSGKVKFQPSTKAGEGGVVIQLNVSKIDCPAIGNDKDKAGKCGPKDAPHENQVLDLSLVTLGLDIPSVAGLKYNLRLGKVVFPATGKNKLTGADTSFAVLLTAVFDSPLGVGVLRMREPGSVPSECDSTPLLPGNGCTDGPIYGLAGITVGNDPTIQCLVDGDCDDTQVCNVEHQCETETCAQDSDCRTFGINPKTACNEDLGQCCNVDTGGPDCDFEM